MASCDALFRKTRRTSHGGCQMWINELALNLIWFLSFYSINLMNQTGWVCGKHVRSFTVKTLIGPDGSSPFAKEFIPIIHEYENLKIKISWRCVFCDELWATKTKPLESHPPLVFRVRRISVRWMLYLNIIWDGGQNETALSLNLGNVRHTEACVASLCKFE